MTKVIFEIDAKSESALQIRCMMIGEREKVSRVEESVARAIIASVALGMSEKSKHAQIQSFNDGSAAAVEEAEKLNEMIRAGFEKGNQS